jgi:hypothetical protein
MASVAQPPSLLRTSPPEKGALEEKKKRGRIAPHLAVKKRLGD